MVVRGLGCNPISAKNRELQKARIAGASSFTTHAWREDAQPGTFAWDSAFEEILDRRTRLADRYRDAGISLYPWDILKRLPAKRKLSERIYWNQGSIPSCSMHGAMHSAQASMLVDIAFGAPRRYDALNPIYPFYIARGGNLGGGLDLAETADQLNRGGAYAASEVGEDNTSAPRDWRMYRAGAAQRQAAIIYIEDPEPGLAMIGSQPAAVAPADATAKPGAENCPRGSRPGANIARAASHLVEKIFRSARAGFHVTFGSGVYYNKSKTDRNGVKVLYSEGYGGHAQSIGSWREVGGTEYVFLTNSWGDAYGSSKEGEPANGGWLDKDALAVLARSMPNYGAPFIALYENPEIADDARLIERI